MPQKWVGCEQTSSQWESLTRLFWLEPNQACFWTFPEKNIWRTNSRISDVNLCSSEKPCCRQWREGWMVDSELCVYVCVCACTCEDVLAQTRWTSVFAVVEMLGGGGALQVLHWQAVAQDVRFQVGTRPQLFGQASGATFTRGDGTAPYDRHQIAQATKEKAKKKRLNKRLSVLCSLFFFPPAIFFFFLQ